MAKTWEELTQAEKIEDLRRDVKRIFEAISQLRTDVAISLSHLEDRVSRVAKEVAALGTKEGQGEAS